MEFHRQRVAGHGQGMNRVLRFKAVPGPPGQGIVGRLCHLQHLQGLRQAVLPGLDFHEGEHAVGTIIDGLQRPAAVLPQQGIQCHTQFVGQGDQVLRVRQALVPFPAAHRLGRDIQHFGQFLLRTFFAVDPEPFPCFRDPFSCRHFRPLLFFRFLPCRFSLSLPGTCISYHIHGGTRSPAGRQFPLFPPLPPAGSEYHFSGRKEEDRD